MVLANAGNAWSVVRSVHWLPRILPPWDLFRFGDSYHGGSQAKSPSAEPMGGRLTGGASWRRGLVCRRGDEV